ncbi:hypothetical protein BKA62DRAFT_671036 [Auriculariales sp. MPI-PUGE-AT-0066]|nr:hypothetical protein BKA62DRAFT_671036 [Auriculariales sp. MPI-PUGE-AT-0066]
MDSYYNSRFSNARPPNPPVRTSQYAARQPGAGLFQQPNQSLQTLKKVFSPNSKVWVHMVYDGQVSWGTGIVLSMVHKVVTALGVKLRYEVDFTPRPEFGGGNMTHMSSGIQEFDAQDLYPQVAYGPSLPPEYPGPYAPH